MSKPAVIADKGFKVDKAEKAILKVKILSVLNDI
jgi:hypothetical protein